MRNLFKAILSFNNEWQIGQLIETNDNVGFIIPTSEIVRDGHHVKVISDFPLMVYSETISQFVGVSDINNKKIFENDIVRIPNPFNSKTTINVVVKFDCSLASFVVTFPPNKVLDLALDISDLSEGEVIGNIHDKK